MQITRELCATKLYKMCMFIVCEYRNESDNSNHPIYIRTPTYEISISISEHLHLAEPLSQGELLARATS